VRRASEAEGLHRRLGLKKKKIVTAQAVDRKLPQNRVGARALRPRAHPILRLSLSG